MFRPISRSLLRQSAPALRTLPRRRCLNTAPPAKKSRSWQSSAIRWGLAGAGIYYYNTSMLFAEEPAFNSLQPDPSEDTTSLPTLSSLSPSSRSKPSLYPSDTPSLSQSPTPQTALDPISPFSTSPDQQPSLEETEEQASQQGAFNEETGEINWDCPCLGGMAHGPCGEQFRSAFSCFVYSKEEPKGMDCIEHFKGMQDCFREHPDVYGSELEEDDEEEGELEGIEGIGEVGESGEGNEGVVGLAREGLEKVEAGANAAKEKAWEVAEKGEEKISEAVGTPKQRSKSLAEDVGLTQKAGPPAIEKEQSASSTPAVKDLQRDGTPVQSKTRNAKAARKQVAQDQEPQSESDDLVPKAAHDATDAKILKTEK